MENLALSARKKFTMDKFFSQVKLAAPNNIKKVVDVSIKSNVNSTEITNNFVVAGGKLTVGVVYLTEENMFDYTETSVDFLEKQKVNFALNELVASDNAKIDHIEVMASDVICSVEHEVSVLGVFGYQVGAFDNNNVDFVFNKKSFECLNFVSSADENFVVAEEFETNLKNLTILSSDANVVVNEVCASVNKVIIDGKINADIKYLDEDGFGELNKEFEFKQEIALKNAMPGMSAEEVCKTLNITVTPDVKEDKTTITVVVDLYAKAFLFENKSVETYDDLFSLKNEITPVYNIIDFASNDGFRFEVDTVLTQSDISGIGDFDDIIGVFNPKVKILGFENQDTKIIISAKIDAVALYKTTAGVDAMNLSYETRFELNKEIEKTLVAVDCYATVSAFKVKAGKDLESAFVLNYKFYYDKLKTEQFVKSYEVLDEKQADDSAIKVYITKQSQSVFEVSKALNVRPDDITSQNEVGDYFEAGQKVYVYSPLNV